MRSPGVIPGCALAAVFLVSTSFGRVGIAGAGECDARIRRVEGGLLPPVLVRGEKPPVLKLGDRMQRWKIPGVSIAVIVAARSSGRGLTE